MSNPSAVDGNYLDETFIKSLSKSGKKIVYDAAYVGATDFRAIPIDSCVEFVVGSMFKPYGMFRQRVGFAWAKCEVLSLFGTRWFYDPERLAASLLVLKRNPFGSLHEKYSVRQQEIVDFLNNKHDLSLTASDSLLMAFQSAAESMSVLEEYRRSDTYRLCLTPFFEKAGSGSEF